ncbi:family 78 glycoside hydrolase catalytic domain [Actinoplanes sp. NPDC051470]|uniref:family 78 glycoside hydrolase catalytic domain n=1 Tax=unclassified Actinoplanes TaxID=2626549 RepID=UPI00341CCDE3
MRRPVIAALALLTVLAGATPAAAAPAGTAAAPNALKVAGQAADALVGSPHPALSWAPRDSRRGEAQSAYQIKVSDHGLVWDSGRVASDASTGVAYAGPALLADHTYSWSVRTWNRRGQASPWSRQQRFDVGPMAVGDWSASWLRVPDGALARRTFDVTKTVARARLYLAAQGLAEPHLNGAVVAPERLLDSSVTDYAKRVLYRSFDVTGQIRRGSNALGVMASQGQFYAPPTFLAQLSLTYADGSRAVIGTDGSWRSAAGPVVRADFYYGETWDARKQIAGWDTPSFDASGWAAVAEYAPVAKPASLAQGRPVTAADETACCGWSRAALVDGIDRSVDGSQGYHSATAASADSTKWVQVDLGTSQAVKSLTLFPARPTNDPAGDFPGAGFPVRYAVQISDDADFTNARTLVDRTAADQPNPGVTPVSIPVDGQGRYVRVTATKLPCRDTSCTFRLAELSLYGANPALTFGLSRLEADVSPPTRIVSTLEPVRVTTPAAGVQVYDFGQNYTGQVTLRASAPAGTTAVITKGELLDSAGRVTTSNISFNDGEPPRQQDRYIFDGSGEQTWMPRLNYAGFRYAEVTGLPAGTGLTVTAAVIHTDVAPAGTFSTSDPLLNRIQDALVRTQLNNLQGMPLDCPTREKRGWLGDAGDTEAEAMANLDMQSLYAKWLADIRTSANSNGSIPSVSPDQGEGDRFFTDPAWATAYPQIVWDSYQQYGDPTVLRDNYDSVKRWVDYLATISDSRHIVRNAPGSWGDDWLSTVSTPHVYFQTLFYLLDSRRLADMATVLGHADDAANYRRLAGEITAGFTAEFFDPATDTYGAGTQLAYAMPLAIGIVPAGHEQAVLRKLVQDIVAHGNHVTTGFVGTTFVYQALGKYDRNDIALAISQRTDFPSFGYMLANGPGTIWEKWTNSSAADGTSSKDHIGLAGSIGQWYYEQLAGIRRESAGWRTLTLAPSVVGDLTRVNGSQDTVRGKVVSSWRRSGSTLTYHAVVPVGSTATIELPLLGGPNSTVREGDRVIWRAGRPAGTVPGLTVGGAAGKVLTMTAGSGDYTFTVTPPATPVTALTVTSAGDNPSPITAGHRGDVSVLVEGSSTGGGNARLSAEVPAGWTAEPAPAAVPLRPSTTATLASLRLTVPAGTPGGTYPVTVTARAPDGTRATATINVIVFGAWPAGATAAASSFHEPNMVDGATRTYEPRNALDADPATFWNDNTENQYPDTLTITAATAVPLTGVGLSSHRDGVLTAFDVQTWDGATWTTQATITGNTATNRWIPFRAPVTTTQVRVVVNGSQNLYSRVAELTP